MKFSNTVKAIALGAIMASVVSCEDSQTAGGSLVADETEIILDSLFTVSGLPDANPSVRSRTVLQLLGRLEAEGYGGFSSDVVCQYMPAANMDTDGVVVDYIDSVKLVLSVYKDGFAGDSVVPMGLSVHRLTKQLPTVLESDFNPDGYYDETPIGSTSYSGLMDGYPYVGTDSEGTMYKNIYVDLPVEFGRTLFQKYIDSPQTFATPQAFAEWFPGLYIGNTFGSGRVTRISNNAILVYYHSVHNIGTDDEPSDTTIQHVGSYLGVTPEVYTNNNITYEMAADLKQMADAGEPILVAPVGYDVDFVFPAREILDRYTASSGALALVNSLTFTLPVEEIENDYDLAPPPYVLMVKKSKKDDFFSKIQVNDNINSFYASYNSSTKSYTFSSMLNYINEIIKKGYVEEEDEEFVICPVLVSYYPTSSSSSYYYYYYYGYTTSTQTVSSITPYVTEPVMGKLDFENAKIQFSFSRQTL